MTTNYILLPESTWASVLTQLQATQAALQDMTHQQDNLWCGFVCLMVGFAFMVLIYIGHGRVSNK